MNTVGYAFGPPGVPGIRSTKELFTCPWFRVCEESWYAPFHGFNEEPFYRIESADGVLVLATTNQGQIILIRQFRHAVRRMTLEFPAGSIEEEETPDSAAARELFEETGYRAGSLDVLGSGHIMANRYSARDYLFFAQDCELDITDGGASKADVHLVSPEEFKGLVESGEFEQIPALALLTLASWKKDSHL